MQVRILLGARLLKRQGGNDNDSKRSCQVVTFGNDLCNYEAQQIVEDIIDYLVVKSV